MTSHKIWSIPYIDQPISFWHEVFEKYGTFIEAVYFPIPLDNIPSGRPLQPTSHLMEFLKGCPFERAVLVNPIILSRSVKEISKPIIEKIKQLYDEYHLCTVTVANLMLAERIKASIPEIKLTASVLMDVFCANQVEMLNDVFDVLVPSSRIVRNLPALQALRKSFEGLIKIIVNEGCLPNCIFRTQHFYEMGAGIEYPHSLCNELLAKKPWLRLTGSWILPQHLNYYDGVYDRLKLSGRVTLQNPEYYKEVLDAYIHLKKRLPNRIGGGPVCGMLSKPIDGAFYKKTLYCSKECSRCSICKEEYHRLEENPHVETLS
jgi:hypothetical protein